MTKQAASELNWWRYGYVWLLIVGPSMVIFASAITVWLTLQAPDPVLSPIERHQTPALQARNQGAPKLLSKG